MQDMKRGGGGERERKGEIGKEEGWVGQFFPSTLN
jgi:hypothetical protein